VVVAVVENERIKRALYQELDPLLPPEAILATNTSSISITRLGAASGRPDRFIGMHFMNPVPMMELVEVIRGLETSDATFEAVMSCARELGKTPCAVNDAPGFVANRVLIPMINEAAFALMEGVGADGAPCPAIRRAYDTVAAFADAGPAQDMMRIYPFVRDRES